MERLLLSLVLAMSVAAALPAQKYGLGAAPIPADISAASSQARTGPSFGNSKAQTVDLSGRFPKPGEQGEQNSCVAWASTYALKSFEEHVERSEGPFAATSTVFSPSFTYNQINGGKDEGSSLYDAATLLKDVGAVPLSAMPYSMDYRRQPSRDQFSQAAPWRIASFQQLKPNDLEAMKDFLRQGLPIVIGMELHASFQDYRGGVYKNASGPVIGGHAMVVVGFDEGKKAFRLINSWGTRWGDGGYAWVDYGVFAKSNRDAMVLFDRQDTRPAADEAAAVKLGVPQDTSASQGSSPDQVEVSWKAVSGAESYEVHRSAKPDKEFALLGEVRGTRYIDKAAKTGEIHYYAVRAKAGDTLGGFSQSAQGFRQTQPGLGIVQELQGRFTDGAVQLWWTPVTGAKGYNVYRFLPDKKAFAKVGTSQDPGWRDRDLGALPGSYQYLVTAVNDKREGPNSDCLSLVVPEQAAPALVSPTGLRASQDIARRIDLTWDAVPGVQQYVILRYEPKREVWKILAGTTATTWTDQKPPSGKVDYAVVSRIGDTVSTIEDFATGWAAGGKPAKPSKRYADDGYYGAAVPGRGSSPDPAWFAGDTSIAKPVDLFKSFVPKDFFFVDEAAFFAVDPDFFKVPDDFFADPGEVFR